MLLLVLELGKVLAFRLFGKIFWAIFEGWNTPVPKSRWSVALPMTISVAAGALELATQD